MKFEFKNEWPDFGLGFAVLKFNSGRFLCLVLGPFNISISRKTLKEILK